MHDWDTLLFKYPLGWFARGELGLSYSPQLFSVVAVLFGVIALLLARWALHTWPPEESMTPNDQSMDARL